MDVTKFANIVGIFLIEMAFFVMLELKPINIKNKIKINNKFTKNRYNGLAVLKVGRLTDNILWASNLRKF